MACLKLTCPTQRSFNDFNGRPRNVLEFDKIPILPDPPYNQTKQAPHENPCSYKNTWQQKL